MYCRIGGKHKIDKENSAVSLIVSHNDESHAYIIIESMNQEDKVVIFKAQMVRMVKPDEGRAIIEKEFINVAQLRKIATNRRSYTWSINKEEENYLHHLIWWDYVYLHSSTIEIDTWHSDREYEWYYCYQSSRESDFSTALLSLLSSREGETIDECFQVPSEYDVLSASETLFKENCITGEIWAKNRLKAALRKHYRGMSWDNMTDCVIADQGDSSWTWNIFKWLAMGVMGVIVLHLSGGLSLVPWVGKAGAEGLAVLTPITAITGYIFWNYVIKPLGRWLHKSSLLPATWRQSAHSVQTPASQTEDLRSPHKPHTTALALTHLNRDHKQKKMIPKDIIITIFNFLSAREIARARIICKIFDGAAPDPFITAWLRENGLKKEDINDLKQFCHENKKTLPDLQRPIKQLQLEKVPYAIKNTVRRLLTDCNPQPSYSYKNKSKTWFADLDSLILRKIRPITRRTYNDDCPYRPYPYHVIWMWDRIDDAQKGWQRVYFKEEKRGYYPITERGKEIIRKLGDYTIRNVVLYSMWTHVKENDPDRSFSSLNDKAKMEIWETKSSESFSSLSKAKKIITEEIEGDRKEYYYT